MVIAAHPDDEVLGCGGTISRLAREGHSLSIAILGEGASSRRKTRGRASKREILNLRKKATTVSKILGARELFLFGLPDNRFDTVPLLDVVKIVERFITDFVPDVIYTHHGGDLNIDHTVVNRAVLTATRTIQGQPVRELYAFEVPSSTDWAFQSLAPAFRPNYFVDISATLGLKIRALSQYETETRPFPHPRSPEAIAAIAQRWGSIVGCEAAEAFDLIRGVNLRGKGH